MIRRVCLVVLLLVACSLSYGQNNEAGPTLLVSFGPNNDDVLNAISNLGDQLTEVNFNPRDEILAVRVCSNDPLPVGLAMANSAPFLTVLKLEKRGIPRSSVFYLRNTKNCTSLRHDYVSTDFWLIPSKSEFPEFVDARRASDLIGYELTHSGTVPVDDPIEVRTYELEALTPQSYQTALSRLVSLMKTNKSAVTVIQVPYYKLTPTVDLTKRLKVSLECLQRTGISRYRIYVRRIYFGEKVRSVSDIPRYPDLSVVTEQ